MTEVEDDREARIYAGASPEDRKVIDASRAREKRLDAEALAAGGDDWDLVSVAIWIATRCQASVYEHDRSHRLDSYLGAELILQAHGGNRQHVSDLGTHLRSGRLNSFIAGQGYQRPERWAGFAFEPPPSTSGDASPEWGSVRVHKRDVLRIWPQRRAVAHDPADDAAMEAFLKRAVEDGRRGIWVEDNFGRDVPGTKWGRERVRDRYNELSPGRRGGRPKK